MEYVLLSDALAVARRASTLDISNSEMEKKFIEGIKKFFIGEHKMGNLSFYNNKGYCIDNAISILLEKYDLTITEDEKSLKLGENCVFPCVKLKFDQLTNLVHERCNSAHA